MKKIIVVKNPAEFQLEIEDVEVVAAKAYLTEPRFHNNRNVRVFNLSSDYRYQSRGYYVSLLAEARGQKVIPSVRNIQDVKVLSVARSISEEIEELIDRSFRKLRGGEFVLSVYFGQNVSAQYNKLAQELFKLFQMPLFRVKFVHKEHWIVQSIKTLSLKDVPDHHMEIVREAAQTYFGKKRYHKARDKNYLYDLAILVNPTEKSPPSNKKALDKFVEAAEACGFWPELITRDDLPHLGEYDALLIRETTSVNHHTWRMARYAQSEGMVVIDDPDSILRCTNKVYLAELLKLNRIPTPRTVVIHSDNRKEALESLGLPCVIKLPDSSFSLGVIKVETKEAFMQETSAMLSSSDLLIGQEFMPSDFDWRIGVLDGKALYACKYFMARNHWQIYNWEGDEKEIEGEFATMTCEEVPEDILKTAVKAANLIGNGLYGVDMKEVKGKPFVIEINDNPNIDYGVEDAVLKDELYLAIMRSFVARIEKNQKKDVQV